MKIEQSYESIAHYFKLEAKQFEENIIAISLHATATNKYLTQNAWSI
jgi:nitrous oxidase accessory protein NosD